ncbi:IS4 family transposase [Stutzerimonas stutzeri]|uniref:IS4 family transposase n=1 Tax=Stutzerimonas stutzeri TaxID=316 RepID=UPI003C6F3074
MSLQQQLLDLGELFNFADLSTFTQNIPIEWVASALDLSAQASIRRRLPGDQVLWLVLGVALFRDEPVHEVARRLNICAQGLASQTCWPEAVLRRRANDWADPVEWLFRQTRSQWGRERYDGDTWQGLHVLAIAGALLRTPDTPELREHFGSGNTPNDRQAPYPMLRLVALMNVRSHLILDAQLSPYRRSEMRLADECVQQIPSCSVTLFDKGFWNADLLLSLAATGENRHWLIPACKGLLCEEVVRYGKGDRLLRMKVSPQARKRNASLPAHWEVREVSYEVKGKTKTVLTSLPADTYSAKAIAQLYQERWEIELGFRDIKSSLQQNAMPLRSKVKELILPRGLGLLLA